MGIIFIIFIIIAAIVSFVYWIRTLMQMAQENILWAIAGFFIAPFAQVVFYITQKDSLEFGNSSIFTTFFVSQVAIVVLAFLAGLLGVQFG